MLIASLSLAAFPFLTGFYSKDLILESSFGQFSFSGLATYVIAIIGAVFTTLYSIKILYLTFLARPNGPKISYINAHEGDLFMVLPLVVLAIFSIFFGFITKDMFIGLGSGLFVDNSIFIHPRREILIATEFAVPTLFKLLPFFCTIFFINLAIVLFEFFPERIVKFKLTNLGYYIFGFFNQRGFIEMFYNKYLIGLALNLGGHTTKVLDKGAIEIVGPLGLERVLIKLSKAIHSLSSGVVTTYALYILLGFISYILAYSWLDFLSVILFITATLIFYSVLNKEEYNTPVKIESSIARNLPS